MPATSVIASRGPGVPSKGTPRSRARGSPAASAGASSSSATGAATSTRSGRQGARTGSRIENLGGEGRGQSDGALDVRLLRGAGGLARLERVVAVGQPGEADRRRQRVARDVVARAERIALALHD